MHQRSRVLGGMVIVCLAFTFYFVIRATAAAEPVVLTHTTLEEFNTGVLYHTGLTREGDGEVQLLVVGISGQWFVDTNVTGLPARDSHTAVHHNGHIIVVGGKEGDNRTKREAYYTTIDPDDHNLANWQTTTPLPIAIYPNGLRWHTSVVVHDRIYVLGGYDDTGQYFNAVSFADINPDGSLGDWSTTTPLPEAAYLAQAAVIKDRVYVVGGRTAGDAALDRVLFASPNPENGQISGWTETEPFVYDTRGHFVAVYDDRLYVVGGGDGVTYSPKVHYAQPDPLSGAISTYVEVTPMENNLYGGAGLAHNSVLLATGGVINLGAEPSTYVGANLIDADGTTGDWQDASLLDPRRFYHAAVMSDDGWLYVIHGNTGEGPPIASINRGATSGAGGIHAPDGTYTSRAIEIPEGSELKELRWNTTIDDPAATSIKFWYRARKTASDVWPGWSGPFLSESGTLTNTLTLDGRAGYFQYRADFTTVYSDQTPFLNAVQLVYVPPVYSIRLTKDATPPSGSIVRPEVVVHYTLTYSNSLTGLTATNAYIFDLVPDQMQYVPGSIYGAGANDSLAPELTWQLGDIAPGGTGEVGFDATVLGATEPMTIENKGLLFSTAGPVRQSNAVVHILAPGIGPRIYLPIVTGAE